MEGSKLLHEDAFDLSCLGAELVSGHGGTALTTLSVDLEFLCGPGFFAHN